jgi:hypothetical protein
MTMKRRFGLMLLAVSAVLSLGPGSVSAATTAAGQSVVTAAGTTTAEPAAASAIHQQDSQPATAGMVSGAGSAAMRASFSCTGTSCGCQGGEDCFDLGKKNLCDGTTWNCTGNSCTCTKKKQ